MPGIDERGIGVERHRPGQYPEVEYEIIRFHGRDVVFVDEEGEQRIYDAADLRLALAVPESHGCEEEAA